MPFLISFVCSVLIALSAQIQIPLTPVPVTLQTLAIIMIAMVGGRKIGVAAVLMYLTEGAMGLPVFAGLSGGAGHLFGPTGGYLFSFLAMAYVAGWCAERGWAQTPIRVLLSTFIVMVINYSFGVIVLTNFVGWKLVFTLGIQPFLLGALLKAIFIAVVIPKLLRTFKNRT